MIQGFSKLSKAEKILLLKKLQLIDDNDTLVIGNFNYGEDIQKQIDNISENTIAGYSLPFSIAPNFLINGRKYVVPMVIEESSVVAAASYAAKFWFSHGGFTSKLIGETKIGQIHFLWNGSYSDLIQFHELIVKQMLASISDLTTNMIARGGGLGKMEILDFTDKISNYYQIRVEFFTVDAMGANFINSCLERMAIVLKDIINSQFTGQLAHCEVIMAILSNYTPNCSVECRVECPIDAFENIAEGLHPKHFTQKFKTAVDIAKIDIYRAVTHNKGIYNGIDAVLLATGNDFRAVEACGHAFACRSGKYRSLSDCEISENFFQLKLIVPIAVGTIGGLTKIHPLAAFAIRLLGNPSANDLMHIAVSTGLANHFSALRSLITHGIQRGHMKMHLTNMLAYFQATDYEIQQAIEYFKNKELTFNAVKQFIEKTRG